jgi:hypothetical protein
MRVLALQAPLLALFVGVVGTAAAISDARPVVSVPVCQAVRLAGGDDNGLTGGVVVAHVFVKNVGRRACAVAGRPWIRIPRLAHPVTVKDISSGAAAGTPSGRVVLSAGELASAEILLDPGRCSRDRNVVFELAARAGWSKRGVPVAGLMCEDGSGQIAVATFRRA